LIEGERWAILAGEGSTTQVEDPLAWVLVWDLEEEAMVRGD